MRRDRPWRAGNESAVIVDRRGPWGNPFRVQKDTFNGLKSFIILYRGVNMGFRMGSRRDASDRSVALFTVWLTTSPYGRALEERARVELAGRDLACWCPPDAPCHADVLLRVANGPRPEVTV
jgi:hypothetical protein